MENGLSIVETVILLTQENPNDADLGQKIREMVNKLTAPPNETV